MRGFETFEDRFKTLFSRGGGGLRKGVIDSRLNKFSNKKQQFNESTFP